MSDKSKFIQATNICTALGAVIIWKALAESKASSRTYREKCSGLSK
jgi:hypothetical protein